MLFELDPALAANQSDKCTPKYETVSRFGDLLCDVNRFLENAGATSQDKNLPSVPVNPLRWKSPDRNIMINKTADEKRAPWK